MNVTSGLDGGGWATDCGEREEADDGGGASCRREKQKRKKKAFAADRITNISSFVSVYCFSTQKENDTFLYFFYLLFDLSIEGVVFHWGGPREVKKWYRARLL